MAAHPDVRDSLVLVREDVPGAKRLVAYVTPASVHADDLRTALRERLPEYMVPSAVVALDTFPLTPNGKVDRKALPAPEEAAGEAAHVAPRSAAEETLAAIWADVLGVPRISVTDNFFALGGDSILAIQVIARARQAGLALSPSQMMQHQTVAELAAVAGVNAAPQADQGPVTGDVPLTPIQRWFWEQKLPQPQHWNQALLFEPLQPLDPEVLEAALRHLLVHHDALRMRVTWDGSQTIAAPGAERLLWQMNLLSGETLDDAAYDVQASLDLLRGPLLRAALINLGAGRGQRLLIAIHHLAVDGVSWRILLEDLHTAYRQIAAGEAPQLPAKTTSYQTWARRLTGVADDVSFWTSQDWSSAAPLPLDEPAGLNLEAMAGEVEVALDPAATRTLLGHGSEAETVLLAALARALGAWTGGAATAVDLEGHGRAEQLVGGVDLSRTVGWFTSIYPVLLQAQPGAAPAETLAAVRAQLARVPHRGAGYGIQRYLHADAALAALPRPQVSFNYLGQLDQALAGSDLLRQAHEPCGAMHSPLGRRTHELEVLGAVTGGRLKVSFTYPAAQLERRTVEHLAESFLAEVQALLGVTAAAADPSLAVLIRAGRGGETPLFMVHSADLLGDRFAPLGQIWHSSQPLYGLYPARLLEQLGAGATLEAIAARFVAAVRAVQPEGPYYLGGYSYGSLVAYEVARQLRAAGEVVERLTVIDDGPGALPGDQALLQAGVAPAGQETMKAFLALMRPAIEARRAYRPVPCDLFVQVVRAAQPTPGVWRPAAYDLGWGELALGGTLVHTLPGDHFTLLQPPHVAALADLLTGTPHLLAAGDD